MRIDAVLNSGGVERFHAVPGMTKQTVGQHSWGVGVILLAIYPKCSKELLARALTHDCPEILTGDIPHPFKQAHPTIKAYLEDEEKQWHIDNMVPYYGLTAEEKNVLSLADCLDGMTYCLERYKAGERQAKAPFLTWEAFLTNDMERRFEGLPEAYCYFVKLVMGFRDL
jgi:5'-deoxynucleotidase YfbR-like HD superfamily hydrolase